MRTKLVGGAVACLACWSLALPVAAAELFGPARVDVMGAPRPAVAVADFDRDGAADLAVVGGSTVRILPGDGLGGFSPTPVIRVGPGSSSVAVGDFNGDGAADLAVTNAGDFLDPSGDTVSILLGDGLGGFSPAPEIRVGLGPSSVAVGEFNGDGAADLAVTIAGDYQNPTGDTVRILLGDGLGGFSQTAEIGVGTNPRFVVVGEFNGDGAADLAVANAFSDSVSILLGDGVGSFVRTVDIGVGDSPRSIAVGEFNGDGAADLAVANSGSGFVSIVLGDGQGGFSSATEIGVGGGGPWSVAVGEFNGDGAADLTVAHLSTSSVIILLGDGRGGFSSTAGIRVGSNPQSVAVGEFNGDGVADLAVGNALSASVSILLGDGLGGFPSTPEIGVGGATAVIVAGEFNGDGVADLAVANGRNDSVAILLGDGQGAFPPGLEIGVGGFPTSAVVGEFNGDGAADLAVTTSGSDSVSILLGDGQGDFSSTAVIGVGSDPWSVAVGEFNGDGAADLAVTNYGSDSVSILLGDGLGGGSPSSEIGVGSFPTSVIVGDFNGDGTSDLAAANGGSDSVSILAGDGLGGFSSTPEIGVGFAPSAVTAGDFNGDGAADLAVANSGSDSVSILLSDGQGGFWSTLDLGVGSYPWSFAVGDFNGDGAADLAVANFFSDYLNILFNRISSRADANGSNRIDGFDIAAVGRGAGFGSGELGYRRNADVDLNGTIDGDDMALVASRFGELRKEVSPLRANLEDPLTADPATITLQQVASEGDLLTVEVRVNDQVHSAAAADFAVTYGPADEQPDRVLGQVLEVVGFEPGSYLAGVIGQVYEVDTAIPGRVEVGVSRLPAGNESGLGEEPLMSLFFRARREGAARLDFAPFRRDVPTLLDAADREVPGVSFVGGVDVSVVDALGGGPPVQKIGFSPELLDFGQVGVGATSRKTLRVSNFGFSELTVVDVVSSLPEFTSFFGSSFRVPPFGFVELPVEFSAAIVGLFSAELVIESDDPQQPDTDNDGFGEIRVALSGRSF